MSASIRVVGQPAGSESGGRSITGVHGGSAQGGDAAAAGRRATESALTAAHDHRVTLIPGAPGFYHHLVDHQGRRAVAVLGPAADLRDGAARARRLRRGPDAARAAGLGGLRAVRIGVGGDQLAEHPRSRTGVGRSAAARPGAAGDRPGRAGRQRRSVRSGPTTPPIAGQLRLAEVPDAGEVGRIAIRGGNAVLRLLAGRRRRARGRTAGTSPATSATWTTPANCTWSTGPPR